MKTIEVKDKTLLIGEREKPQIGDHEVLIKVKASGINRADIAQKNGLYPPPPGACLLYTSPSPRDVEESRMPSSA